MIVIKLIILVMVFGASLSIGMLIAKKYANRVRELKEMRNALNMFETKIKFTYESVPEIFNEISKQIEGEVGKIFGLASKKMQDISAGEAWNQSIETINTSFDMEDKTILKSLGKMLGKTDANGQISEIRLVSEFLDTQIEVAEVQRNKNEKMYKTLGGVIGLTLVIIFI